MNPYGQMAMEHWRKYRPKEYAQISNPETFFRTLGEEIERRILDREDQIVEALPPNLPFQERVGRMSAARSTAEREVLEEMLPRAEDDETTAEESETGE